MAEPVSMWPSPRPQREFQTHGGRVGSAQCTLAQTRAARALAPSQLGGEKTATHFKAALWPQSPQCGRDQSVAKTLGVGRGPPSAASWTGVVPQAATSGPTLS